MTKFKYITKALDLEDSLSNTINIKKKLLVYWLSYTALFAVIFLIGFSVIWINNKSFLWIGDGLNNMLPAMKYMGEYWRAFFANILSGNFQFPMFDFRLGLGDDIIQAMANNQFGGVAHFFSLFIPSHYVDVYYDIVVIFRIYLSGLTFSILCIYARQKYWAILIGSLCYIFSGFVLKSILHPMFPMVYSPLLFMGLDLILRKKKAFLFIICVFLMAMTSFYYLYMITIFLIIFALLRVHHLHGKLFWKNILPSALQVSLYYIMGIMMSAVLFLPTIMGFLESSRTGSSEHLGSEGVDVVNHLFYSLNNILNRLLFFVSWDGLYLAGIVTLALAALFIVKINKNEKRHLIVFFIFSWLLFLIPFGGLLLNGFAYVSDRWIFLFNFVLCFITVYILPDNFFEGKRKIFSIGVLIIGIAIYAIEFGFNLNPESANYFITICSAICILIFCYININQLLRKIIIIALAVINLTFNTYIYTTIENNDFFTPKKAGIEWHIELPKVPELTKMADKSFYRMDTPKPIASHVSFPLAHLANAPLFLDYYGNSVYFSVLNKNVIKCLKELENSNVYDNIYYGFDGRTVLNTLSSNKYYALKYEEQWEEGSSEPYIQLSGTNIVHPYGYTLCNVDESHFQLTYQNEYFLPLGYTYDKAVSYKEYEKLNAIDKQEAILQAVVLDAEYVNKSIINKLSFTTKEIPYNYQLNGCIWKDGIIYKTQGDSSITLFFDGEDNCETYIQFSGLKNYELFLYNIIINVREYTFKGTNTELIQDQEKYIFNLGYSEEGLKTATILFPDLNSGYELKDIKIFCYPMDNYPGQVNALNKETLKNININTNRVSGEITVTKNKFLVLSIPYSKGWSAKVNGVETELLQANTMFMALPLSAGKHIIELNYCTPGIKLGGWLSVTGFAVFSYLIFRGSKHCRKSKNKGKQNGK